MGWPRDAYVGQKVVCVDDTPEEVDRIVFVIKGNIYTISRIGFIIYSYKPKLLGFDLLEIDTSFNYERMHPSQNVSFKHTRFRPVQSTDKGMEVLKGLLNPINHKVLEDA